MTTTAPSTRDRMVASASRLLLRRGPHGVTIDAVLADSAAPRGSVYHHFPGGRGQILREAGATSASIMTAMIATLERLPPEQVVTAIVSHWSGVLISSEFTAGCPVAALTGVDRDLDDDALRLARESFRAWTDTIASSLLRQGHRPEHAHDTATLVLAAVEGAIILCRAEASTEPLDRLVPGLVRLVGDQRGTTPAR